MLEEAVTIIAELFTGEQLTYHGPHYQVETARLYSVPSVPPPIYVSGFGEKSAIGRDAFGSDLLATAGLDDRKSSHGYLSRAEHR
jgi:alkanesulfonate monooxygenase SsuD/methylene tetrahydromethanopterin reductase-like flavin-dependent oxidoreductase (luciferase family)